MKKKNVIMFLLVVVMTMGVAHAAGTPSSKATCKVGDIAILDATEMGWTTILSNRLKTGNKKDLFIDVSLECGLYTDTKVDSLDGIEDMAKAEAGIKVRVLVDSIEALPGAVMFAKRSQVLMAEFQGLLTDEDGNVCINVDYNDIDPNLHDVTLDVNCLRPETLELVLNTMTANSFNFIYQDVESGIHTIEVQARIETVIESTLDSGTKVKPGIDDIATSFTVERAGKIVAGDVIIIDNEKIYVVSVDNKLLSVTRGYDGTTATSHGDRTRIYLIAGAEAMASIGKGSVTVEAVRMINKGADIEL